MQNLVIDQLDINTSQEGVQNDLVIHTQDEDGETTEPEEDSEEDSNEEDSEEDSEEEKSDEE